MKSRKVSGYLVLCAVVGVAGASARAEVKLAQERFFGRGTRGPYSISRQSVIAQSEMVTKNGMHLVRGRDFLFDAGLGALSFTDSVSSADVIEVDYQYDTAVAKVAGPSGGTLNLFGGSSGGLAFSYGFRPDAKGGQQVSNFGFSGQALLGTSKLSTSFLTDKAGGGGKDAQNVQLGMVQETGKLQYNIGYSRVGMKFGQAEAMKLTRGTEALNMTGSFQFAKSGLLTVKRVQNDLTDAKTGATKSSSLLSSGLNLDLAQGSRLTALHETQSNTTGKDNTTSAVDRLQLDQKLAGNASATLIQETVANAKNGQGETVKATRLNTTMSGDNGLKVDTALALTDSSKSGNARDASLKIAQGAGSTKLTFALTNRHADAGDLTTHALGLEQTLKAGFKFAAALAGDKGTRGSNEHSMFSLTGGTTPKLQFSAAMTTDSGAKSGTGTAFSFSSAPTSALTLSASRNDAHINDTDTYTTAMKLEASAAGGVKIAANFNDSDDGKIAKSSNGVSIDAKPSEALHLAASMGGKSDEKGDLQTKAVQVEAAPNQAFSVAASYTGNTDQKGLTEASKVSIATKSGEVMKLTASYSDGQAPTGASSTKEASIGLTPVKNKLSLSGSYSDQTKADKTEIQIATIQANIKPMEALAVTGFYKSRDTGGPDQINTMNAQVAVGSEKLIQMIGTYSANPEEKDQVLRLVRRGLSLQSHLGALTFAGGYLQEESLIDDSAGSKADFKLGLRFSKNTLLEGGYQQTLGAVRGFKPLMAYNVKFTHNMGQDLNMSLAAAVTQKDNSVPVNQRQDVQATANLGVRF